MLEKLDGLRLADTFAGNLLKNFHLRQWLRLNRTSDLNHEVVSNLEDFLAVDNGDFSNMSNNFANN